MPKTRTQPKKKIKLDFSSENTGTPVMKFVADAITSAGAIKHQIAIDIDGTTFYINVYATGS